MNKIRIFPIVSTIMFFGIAFQPVIAIEPNTFYNENDCDCITKSNQNFFKIKDLNESSQFCDHLNDLLDFQSDRLYILKGLYEIFFKELSIIGMILNLRISVFTYVLLFLGVIYGVLCFNVPLKTSIILQ